MGVDSRRTLASLHAEWSTCSKCPLGEQRLTNGAHFVPGTGTSRSMMFIGDSPDEAAERTGRPFSGSVGGILHTILGRLGMKDYYCTNLVACRSCTPQVNAGGEPVVRKGVSMYRDEPPIPAHCNACRPRLEEEIYIVNPTVIVGLGPKACEAMTGRTVNLATKDNGEARPISIRGASFNASLTDSGHWLRKVRKEWIQPTVPSQVFYHFIPTYHPLQVQKTLEDRDSRSMLNSFTTALRNAIATHDMYLEKSFGVIPARAPVTDQDLQQAVYEATT